MDEDDLPPLKRPRLRPRGRKPSKCTFNYVDDPSVKTPPVQATVQEEVHGDQLSLHDHSLHARQQVGSVDIQPNSVTSAGEQEALNQDGSDEVVTTSAPMSSGNRDSQSASRRPVSTSSIVSGTPVKSARQQGERHSRAEQVIRTTVEKPSCHMQLRSATRKIASHDQNSRIIPDRLEMRHRPTKQALNVTSPLQRTLRIMSPQSGPSFRIPDTSLDSTCLTTSAPMPECDSPCTVHLIGKKRTAKDVTELDVLLTHMEDVFSDFKQSLNGPRYVSAIDDVLNIVQSEFSKAIAKENEMKLFQSKIHLAEVHLQRDRKKLLSLQQQHVSALHYLKQIEGELKVLQRSQSRLFISQYFSALSSFIHMEVAKSSTLTNQKSKASLKCNNKR